MGWWWDLWAWEGAYPRNKAENSQTPSRGINMQKERVVADSVFDIGLVAMWDMSLCDSSFGGLDGWGSMFWTMWVKARLGQYGVDDDVVILYIPLISVWMKYGMTKFILLIWSVM